MDRWIEVLDGSMDRAMDRMDRGSERVLDKNLELGQPNDNYSKQRNDVIEKLGFLSVV